MKIGNVTLSQIQLGVVITTLITAVIHIAISGSGILMLLNGLGYLALLAALYFLPQFKAQRSNIRWVMLGYTAITIILYFVSWGADGFSDVLGMITKVDEVALLALLWLDK